MNQARRKTLDNLGLHDDLHEPLRAAHEVARSALDRDDKVTPGVVWEICKQVEVAADTAGVADHASGVVQAEAEAEQEGYDNLSEGLQQTERGRGLEEASGCLQDAAEALYRIVVDLSEAEKVRDALLKATEDTLIDEEEGLFAWTSEDEAEQARELVESLLALLSSAEDDALVAAEQIDQAVAC